jgi:hypothetical protein
MNGLGKAMSNSQRAGRDSNRQHLPNVTVRPAYSVLQLDKHFESDQRKQGFRKWTKHVTRITFVVVEISAKTGKD